MDPGQSASQRWWSIGVRHVASLAAKFCEVPETLPAKQPFWDRHGVLEIRHWWKPLSVLRTIFLSNCRYCADRAQCLPWPAPNIWLTMFQISSKSIHFRRSHSRPREGSSLGPLGKSNTRPKRYIALGDNNNHTVHRVSMFYAAGIMTKPFRYCAQFISWMQIERQVAADSNEVNRLRLWPCLQAVTVHTHHRHLLLLLSPKHDAHVSSQPEHRCCWETDTWRGVQ